MNGGSLEDFRVPWLRIEETRVLKWERDKKYVVHGVCRSIREVWEVSTFSYRKVNTKGVYQNEEEGRGGGFVGSIGVCVFRETFCVCVCVRV